MISSRAARFAQEPSSLVVAHFACAADPYDAERNPKGYINFGTAENHLLWDLVEPALAASRARVAEDAKYGLLYGTAAFRARAADLLARTAGGRLDPEHIVVASGASAILDMLAYTLCDPGEGVLIPTPYYPGFKMDLTTRARARIVPVPLSSADGFALDVGAFERALAQARAEGVAVRALLITSPHNPLGRTHPTETLRALLQFAQSEGLHVIFDEIYANSVFGRTTFESALALAADATERVHVVYGFAKDFALSGFKVGLLHTKDARVLAACRELAYLAPVSTDTQASLTQMLADEAWLDLLQTENRKRLAASYAHLTQCLGEQHIAHLPADAGVFVWLDLRNALTAPTWEAEAALHERIVEKARVNITPGAAFACDEPGWFRLCYAQPEATVWVGVERLGRVLRPE